MVTYDPAADLGSIPMQISKHYKVCFMTNLRQLFKYLKDF